MPAKNAKLYGHPIHPMKAAIKELSSFFTILRVNAAISRSEWVDDRGVWSIAFYPVECLITIRMCSSHSNSYHVRDINLSDYDPYSKNRHPFLEVKEAIKQIAEECQKCNG